MTWRKFLLISLYSFIAIINLSFLLGEALCVDHPFKLQMKFFLQTH